VASKYDTTLVTPQSTTPETAVKDLQPQEDRKVKSGFYDLAKHATAIMSHISAITTTVYTQECYIYPE
jgi:hypothetical protein